MAPSRRANFCARRLMTSLTHWSGGPGGGGAIRRAAQSLRLQNPHKWHQKQEIRHAILPYQTPWENEAQITTQLTKFINYFRRLFWHVLFLGRHKGGLNGQLLGQRQDRPIIFGRRGRRRHRWRRRRCPLLDATIWIIWHMLLRSWWLTTMENKRLLEPTQGARLSP